MPAALDRNSEVTLSRVAGLCWTSRTVLERYNIRPCAKAPAYR